MTTRADLHADYLADEAAKKLCRHCETDLRFQQCWCQPETPVHHGLKCWPGPFAAIRNREKMFEIRKNDRCFQRGDTVQLYEFIPYDAQDRQETGKTGRFTGEVEGPFLVSFVLSGWGLQPDHVCLQLAEGADATRALRKLAD